jgi:glycosyltransferase involved in cell wall biosynthesis
MGNLTTIVPVSRMGGRLQLLATWLPKALDLGIYVVLVHDKQDDETGPELNALITKLNHENLSFVEGVFNSPGLARNAGLELSSTRWISFWDSDDLVFPEIVLQELSENHTNDEVICFQYDEITDQNLMKTKKTENRDQLIKSPGIWRLIILRDLIGQVKFREFPMAEDQVFLWETGAFDSKILYSNRVVYAYSIGDPNQATASKKKINSLTKVIKCIKLNQIPKSSVDRKNLVIRLSLTLVKRGSARQKLYGIYHLASRGHYKKIKHRVGR